MNDREGLLRLVQDRSLGALATIRRNGRPQLSHVGYWYEADHGQILMSVTMSRAKVKNLRRDPRGTLLVSSPDGWAFTVVDGDVTLSAVAATTHDDTVEELVALYRSVSGAEHPDWDEYRHAMVQEQRLVARLSVDHVYGVPGSGPT